MMLNECNGCEYQCKLSHIDICTLGSPCPHQRSTPMTNEEWFCQLPTEEKAKFLAAQQLHSGTIASRSDVDWEVWLKEKHNESV